MKTITWDGKPVTKPGVYDGVPMSAYHSQAICAGPSVSSSNLRRALEANGGSPAHMHATWSGNPHREEEDESSKRHLILGRAVHHLMLGQPNFAREFIVRPDEVPDRKTGVLKPWQSNRAECRAWTHDSLRELDGLNASNFRAWFEQSRPRGRTILTREDVEHIKGMAVSLGQHPLVRGVNGHGLLNGVVERSFFWRDEKTGLWLKARPDSIPTDSGDYADLKTTTSVQYGDLMRAVGAFAYHQQAALIGEGSQRCAGIPMASFTFVFVEKKPPYCVRLVMLKDEDLALGRKQNRAAIDLIAGCIKRGVWPGPGGDDVVHIDLGSYYRQSAERDVSEAERGEMS